MIQLVGCFHTILDFYERNLFDEQGFLAIKGGMVALLKCPGVAAYWQELRLEYPHNVSAYLDRAVAESDKCPYTQYLPIFMTDT